MMTVQEQDVETNDGAVPRAPVVVLRGVGKRYGQRWAIRNVDLTLRQGEVVGFIGPNGAGKTTLMKLMAGLSQATEGEITVLQHQLHGRTPTTPDGIGLVLEQIGFIPYLSGRKNLAALAAIRGIATADIIDATLMRVGLDPHDKRPVRGYSLGMRQRLGLAQALIESPQLLLLDEPTNGLDPNGIIDLRQLIRQLAQTGTTIFLASHLLTEVEQVCDRAILVQNGAVVREIVPSAEQPRVRIVVSDDTDADLLIAWAHTTSTSAKRMNDTTQHPTFHLEAQHPTPYYVRELVAAGINIEAIGQARQTLEEAFLALVDNERP